MSKIALSMPSAGIGLVPDPLGLLNAIPHPLQVPTDVTYDPGRNPGCCQLRHFLPSRKPAGRSQGMPGILAEHKRRPSYEDRRSIPLMLRNHLAARPPLSEGPPARGDTFIPQTPPPLNPGSRNCPSPAARPPESRAPRSKKPCRQALTRKDDSDRASTCLQSAKQAGFAEVAPDAGVEPVQGVCGHACRSGSVFGKSRAEFLLDRGRGDAYISTSK